MKKSILITAAIIIATNLAFTQGTAINTTGAAAHNSAILDVSDTTKGILIPRMKKTNKLAVASPVAGLLVYQTDDTTGFWYYNGAKWIQAIGPAGATGPTGPTGAGGAPCGGAPPTPGPIIGEQFLLINKVYSYMVAPVAGATTYTWNYSGTGAIISGATNPVSIYFAANATGGDLTVTASCGNGDSTSAPLSLHINASSETLTYTFTGSVQTWQVPSGVNWILADLYGGKGLGTTGGNGGQAKGYIIVTPGQTLNLCIDRYNASPTYVGCGFNPGGGAVDIRIGGTALSDRKIVAGGGGGEGWDIPGGVAFPGGAGGALIGGNGAGGGATQFAGGSAGSGTDGNGTAGALGQGGNGVSCSQSSGGGGGYYGGGGGGHTSGQFRGAGGGGSNYFDPSVIMVSNLQGAYTSDYPKIIISY